jgi:2'-5' RNA ligase
MRGDKIISIKHREIEKFLSHFYTDCMKSDIFRSRAAKSIAIKSSHRIATTTFQFRSKYVSGHGAILTLEINFVNYWILENTRKDPGHSSIMKSIVVAYWLMPAEPAHSFFQHIVNDLAERYDAPVFEPHVTVHVGANRPDKAERALSKAASDCKQIKLKALEIDHSSEFIKTLFLQFALNGQLQHLNQRIRDAAQDSSDYELNPHLSLLYKTLSTQDRRLLTHSIEVPFYEVIFDSLKAVQCISPTQSRADVEAWRLLAERNL